MTFQVGQLDALTTELWETRGERGHITRFICDTGLLVMSNDKCKYDNGVTTVRNVLKEEMLNQS